jgi:hypothetical protein
LIVVWYYNRITAIDLQKKFLRLSFDPFKQTFRGIWRTDHHHYLGI